MKDFFEYVNSLSLLFEGATLEISYADEPNNYFKVIFAGTYGSNYLFQIIVINGPKAGCVIGYIEPDASVHDRIAGLPEEYVRTTFSKWGWNLRRIIRRQ